MILATILVAGQVINAIEEKDIIENVIGFSALYNSLMKCKRGVLWKDSVASFFLRSGEKIFKLSKELHKGTYKPKPTVHFKIKSPKERDISSIAIEDRVYQRSLNDNVVYPTMTKSLIYDNWACQAGKGTDKARERLKEFLRRYYRKYGSTGYVLQFDIKGYYPNMSHKLVKDMFKEKLDPWSYNRVEEILDFQYPGEKGYNPGSQLIQIAGITFLDKLDHFIKEQLHAKYYIRYMDDFLIISDNAEYLERCKREIESKLRSIELESNPRKTKIYKLEEGIEFLGFNFKLTVTGKVLMLICSSNVKRERLKLRRLVRMSLKGNIPKVSVDKSYESWKAHALKGNNYNLLMKMDEYYRNLWKEEAK